MSKLILFSLFLGFGPFLGFAICVQDDNHATVRSKNKELELERKQVVSILQYVQIAPSLRKNYPTLEKVYKSFLKDLKLVWKPKRNFVYKNKTKFIFKNIEKFLHTLNQKNRFCSDSYSIPNANMITYQELLQVFSGNVIELTQEVILASRAEDRFMNAGICQLDNSTNKMIPLDILGLMKNPNGL